VPFSAGAFFMGRSVFCYGRGECYAIAESNVDMGLHDEGLQREGQ